MDPGHRLAGGSSNIWFSHLEGPQMHQGSGTSSHLPLLDGEDNWGLEMLP